MSIAASPALSPASMHVLGPSQTPPSLAQHRSAKASIFQRASRLAAPWLLGWAFFTPSMAMNNPLDVSVRIHQLDQQLRVEWTVKNTGTTPLWVMRAPVALGDLPAPELYVQPGPAGTVEFSLKAFALPDGVLAYTFEYIDLQALKPGAQWQAAADMHLPLMTRAAYGHFNATTPLPAGARTGRLCIGYLPQASEAIASMPKQPDDTLRLAHEPGLVEAQKLACSPVVTW